MNESKPTPSRATVCETCQAQAGRANIQGEGRREAGAVRETGETEAQQPRGQRKPAEEEHSSGVRSCRENR